MKTEMLKKLETRLYDVKNVTRNHYLRSKISRVIKELERFEEDIPVDMPDLSIKQRLLTEKDILERVKQIIDIGLDQTVKKSNAAKKSALEHLYGQYLSITSTP